MRKERKDKGIRQKGHTPVRKYYRKKTKGKISVTLDRPIIATLDLQSRERRQSVSILINEILSVVLGSQKSFLKFELMETSKRLNYLKYEAQNYNDDGAILDLLMAGR